MQHNHGFTLIEMMVTIAIIAILAVMGASFTANWVRQAEINKTTASLRSAINTARSTALRNQFLRDSDAAARICVDVATANQHRITIREATSTGAASCSSTTTYSFTLPDSATIAQSGTAINCIAFDRFGAVIASGSGSTACTTSTSLTITSGGLSETFTYN